MTLLKLLPDEISTIFIYSCTFGITYYYMKAVKRDVKSRLLKFRMYHNFANLFSRLSVLAITARLTTS